MKVPPFKTAPQIGDAVFAANGPRDHLSKSGAERAARMIIRAWALAGHAVDVPIKRVDYGSQNLWSVDMSAFVGGLPPR